jgi:hypothetical protein
MNLVALFRPQTEHGKILPVWLQEVVQHQWDPRVGIPTPPEMGYGRGAMESPVVVVLNIGKTLIPCTWMLRVVHAQDVHNHLIDDLCLAISLGVERSGFSELGVQQ